MPDPYLDQDQFERPELLSEKRSHGAAVRSSSSVAAVRDRGELHVHMNGAIPISTIREILTNEATVLPADFLIERDLIRQVPSQFLVAYLTPWQILRRFPRRQDSLDRLCLAVVAGLAANAVRFVELRSSVLYLSALQECSPVEALERLIESTGDAAEQHGIRRGLILTVTRGDNDAVALSALLEAYQDLGEPRDVVGIDLAGDEEAAYSPELPAMFREAKDRFGLGITIHAGETGRVENVRAAVEYFDADRIGHGTAAGKDPHLLDLLAAQDICVEVCPISNRLTGAVRDGEAHPLMDFQRHGVPFVICSDNPAIHQRGLADDQSAAISEGMSAGDMHQQYAATKRYSFMKDLN